MTGPRFTYKAFVSYKHGTSAAFAADLESALKEYAKPLLTPPIRIFRDEKYIVPDVDLPKLIKDSLGDSEFLLLLASPDAARSPWVRDELHHWCGELKRTTHLIVLLLEGCIAVDSSTKAIDWSRTDALPPLLSNYLTAVPFYLDFTQGDYPPGTGLRHPAFRDAVNRIMARFRGVSLNDMVGIEVRQHRKNLRLRTGAICVIAALGIAALAASIIARGQRNDAVSRLLASQALLPEARIDAAMLTAVAAYETSATREAAGALQTLANNLHDVERVFAADEPLLAGALDASASHLAVAGRRGTLAVWDLKTGATTFEGQFETAGPAAGITFSAKLGEFVALSRAGEICAIEPRATSANCRKLDFGAPLEVRSTKDGDSVIVLHDLGRFTTVNLETLATSTVSLPGDGHDLAVMSWDVSPDGSVAIVGTYDGQVTSLALSDGSTTQIRAGGSPVTHAVRFDSSGAKVALGDAARVVRVLDVSSGEASEAHCAFPVATRRLAFVANKIVGAGIDGSMYTCATPEGMGFEQWRTVQKGNLSELLPIVREQQRMVLVSEDGTAVVRRLSISDPVVTLPGPGREYSRLAFAGNSSLVAGTDAGQILVWKLDNPGLPAEIGQLGAMVRGLAITPDGTRVAFAGQSEAVTVMGIDGKASISIPVVDAPFDYVTSLDFPPDGEVLAVGSAAGKLSLYDALSGAPIGKTQPKQHPNTMCCIAFDQSGGRLYSADNDGNILSRDASTASPNGELAPAHAGIVGGLAATDSRDEVLSVGMDGRIVIDVAGGSSPRCEVRHPDGSITLAADHASAAPVFASISRGSVVVWKSDTNCQLIFQAPVAQSNHGAVAVSPDGSAIAWSTWESPVSLLRLPDSGTLAQNLCRRVAILDAVADRLSRAFTVADCR